MANQPVAHIGVVSAKEQLRRIRSSKNVGAGEGSAKEGRAKVNINVDSDGILDQRFPFCSRGNKSLLGFRVRVELRGRAEDDS